MGAYIINVPDTVDTIIYVNIGDVYDGKTYIASQRVEDLTPYTEPDLDAIKQEEYEKGCKTAKVQCDIQTEKDLREVGRRHYQKGYQDATVKISSNEQAIAEKAYQKGLSDAWEAARKICLGEDDGGIPASAINDIFNVRNYRYAVKDYSASECIEKIRQYEQEKEELIQVGDEVEWMGDKYVVTYVRCEAKKADLISCKFGSACENVAFSALVKTGRHFPEIAAVLEKMKES